MKLQGQNIHQSLVDYYARQVSTSWEGYHQLPSMEQLKKDRQQPRETEEKY